ncbi:MAG: CpcT/CpeT family chromophore lyase [Planctomycetota bacterium]|nr:CpcT/CpeT family chromophore lyase [Planctomycetota bacterium]
MKTLIPIVTAAALLASSGLALAQDAAAPAAQPAAAPAPESPSWSSEDIAKIGNALRGSWKSTPVKQGDDAAQTTEIVLNIAPVKLPDVPDALYVEAARADAMHRPYRTAIFQIYAYKGGHRLRTYEINRGSEPLVRSIASAPQLAGLWAAPDLFPAIARSDLYATLDLDLTVTADGFTGKTPYPYPTGVGGAVEMTSELSIAGDTMTSIDRGIAGDGRIVWGSGENERYTFKKFTPSVTVDRKEGGLAVITFSKGDGQTAITTGDRVAANYAGWLANGTQFDTSLAPGRQPLVFQHGGLIQGWNVGLLGLSKGSIVRLVVPPAMGYGDRPAGPIPPGSTLYFEVEIKAVDRPVAPPTAPTAPAAPAAPASGGDGHNHDGHNHDGHDHSNEKPATQPATQPAKPN